MINISSKISVVVPIYNVEEYLPRCIDSILAQTYSNIEVLLVDDGSPDNAGDICDQYSNKDSRVKVFHIPNGGVAKARQLGVEKSSGEYIVFVDPDDWLPLDSIEILYSYMTDDIDIVNGTMTAVTNRTQLKEYAKELVIKDLTKQLLLYKANTGPVGKLYRRNLFDKDSFPNTKRSQDTLMCLEISTRVRALKIISESVYYYYLRGSSITNQFKFDMNFALKYDNFLKDFLTRNNIFQKYEQEYCYHTIRTLENVIKSNKPIDVNDPLVKDIIERTDTKELTKKYKIIFMLIKYPYLRPFYRVARWCVLLIKKSLKGSVND